MEKSSKEINELLQSDITPTQRRVLEAELKKKEVPEKAVTQAQINLIKELYVETNYSRTCGIEELQDLSRSWANKHIQMLKDLKSRQYQERMNHEGGPVFDKIGFGMVFKLLWRACCEMPTASKPSKTTFEDMLCREYKVFKDAQEACRQFVADGGLK